MSAVREAMQAVLDGLLTYEAVSSMDTKLLLDELVAAVERVPVQVTIRELDMADPENIVTVPYGGDMTYLYGLVMTATMEHLPLHLTVDTGGALKLKVGHYSWSAPIRTEEYAG